MNFASRACERDATNSANTGTGLAGVASMGYHPLLPSLYLALTSYQHLYFSLPLSLIPASPVPALRLLDHLQLLTFISRLACDTFTIKFYRILAILS